MSSFWGTSYESDWINNLEYLYSYDENNYQTEFIGKTWNGTEWINDYWRVDTYEGDNLVEFLSKRWNNSNGLWINDGKGSFLYSNLETEFISQLWDDALWVNDIKRFWKYDENNNQIEYWQQFWNGSDWVNNNKVFYDYDDNNNVIEIIYQLGEGILWINYSKTVFIYLPLTGINDEIASINSFKLYNNFPNPFNPTTNISYSISQRTFVNLKVYNILGKEIATLVNEEKSTGTYEVKFDGSNLSSGVYFYRMQAGDFVDTKKLILMK